MTIDPANPAPGRLRLVQQFVNTADRYGGHDDLPASEVELHALREALRDLAAANTAARPPDAEAIAAFNAIARRHPSTVALDAEAGALGASLGSSGADVAAVLCATVHEAVRDGTWPRLKACASPDCGWLFYDTSRSRTGRWCSMAACGSIAKARAYRRRAADR